MPSLEEWFNIVATFLDATCLEAPVTMNIAKTAGYRVAMVGGLCYWAFDSARGWVSYPRSRAGKSERGGTEEGVMKSRVYCLDITPVA